MGLSRLRIRDDFMSIAQWTSYDPTIRELKFTIGGSDYPGATVTFSELQWLKYYYNVPFALLALRRSFPVEPAHLGSNGFHGGIVRRGEKVGTMLAKLRISPRKKFVMTICDHDSLFHRATNSLKK